ncbi:MAG TPA: aldehyde ferredoxin oxidoreductase C-terminal domain-containing protein [Natrialbaceae archaeon]|nr:aldehyde ferredoxin oxidoreductase C-terminal domain-containing protein [Natrialbaceae archaeon]
MLHARGTLLSIDLDDRSTATESIDDVLESFVGGRGVGTKLAHDRIPFDVDPLSGANRLVFTTGPMQQSNMSFTGRMNCTGVSPLTGGLLSSNAGGYMSRPFSDTGHAAIEITGASDDLVAVHVTDEGVEFEDVSDLAGADVPETVEYVEETRDLDASHVAAIGPAGENEVRFAAIMTSESRAFGRGGLGAVFGAKNLKAITFDGDSAPEIDIPDVTGEIHREAATSDSIMKRQGTTATVDLANEVDALPTYYFADQSFEGAEGINGDAVEAKKYRKGTCSQCAFACKLPTRDEESGLETEGPEYETTMSFGSNAGVDDIVAVMKSNDLCDEYGLDTISAGDVVSAYLASEDEFGNVALIHDLVEKIAHREGVGDTLAEGIDRIHDDLGVENWSVKGLEFPAHDGRALNGMGLGFATSNRGADHLYSTFYEREYPLVGEEKAFPPEGLDGKPAALVEKENTNAVLDSGVICRFSRDFVDEERLSTLFDTDWPHLLDVGGRIVDLERHFNNRRGFDREEDRLPYDLPGFEAALDEYYENRGWTSAGIVPDEQVS